MQRTKLELVDLHYALQACTVQMDNQATHFHYFAYLISHYITAFDLSSIVVQGLQILVHIFLLNIKGKPILLAITVRNQLPPSPISATLNEQNWRSETRIYQGLLRLEFLQHKTVLQQLKLSYQFFNNLNLLFRHRVSKRSECTYTVKCHSQTQNLHL